MTKIRLQPTSKGSKYYRIVIIDARKGCRSGRFIDIIGTYNALAKTDNLCEKLISFSSEKYDQYIQNGAQPTDPVRKLVNAFNKKK